MLQQDSKTETVRLDDPNPAQTQTAQVIQPGGELASYIYINQSSPPNLDEESQGVSQPREKVTIESDPIAELVEALPCCEEADTFVAVIEYYSSEAVEAAIALQPDPLRLQLQGWFEQLSQSELTAAAQLAQSQPEQLAEQQWGITRAQAEMGGSFEWIRGGLVRVAYAAADFVKLITGEFVSYRELRLLQ